MEWIPFEVHPETPPEGVLLTDMFPGTDFSRFYPKLARRSGVPDLPFGSVMRLVNSRLSLKAMMFLQDADVFPAFHENMFRAHFAEGRNISLPETIIDVARTAGISDTAELETMLLSGDDPPGFAAAVKLSRQSGITGVPVFIINDTPTRAGSYLRSFSITSVPAFIINDTHRIVGVQPLEQFREVLRHLHCI